MKTITLYEFNELSKEAQDTAIRNYCPHYDMDFVIKEETETLEELGFTDVSLCYRISFSQGDHVKTNGDISFADAVKLTGYKLSVLKTEVIDDWVELEITGSRVNVSWYYDRDLNYVDATVAAVVRELEDWIERNDKAIYRRLSDELMEQLSDESKRADLEAFPDTWYFENGIRELI